jgi:hypothetical protein
VRPSRPPREGTVEQIYQSDLSKTGVKANLGQVETTTYNDRIAKLL